MSKRNKLRGKMDNTSSSLDEAMYENQQLPESFVANIDTRVEKLLAENRSLKDKVEELQLRKESGIVPTDSGSLLIHGSTVHHSRAQFTAVGMQLPEDLTVDEWADIGVTLLSIKSALSWYLGDWLIAGENQGGSRWEGTYKELADHFHYEIHTLETYASVCRKIHSSTRVEGLSFAHHRYVTKFADGSVQNRLLHHALAEKFSTRDFETYIKMLDDSGNLIPQIEAQTNGKLSRIPTKFSSFLKAWTPQQYNRMSSDEQLQLRQDLEMLLAQMDKWDNSR